MALFEKKTVVEKYEEQFNTKEMQNKHLFYDLYARVGDPEELRGYTVQTLQDLDWKIALNELTKFEELDVEGIFRGGRLKPFKNIIKAHKLFNKGPKYPFWWKLFTIIGIAFVIFYFYTLFDKTRAWNTNLILIITPIWFILSILIYMIKEVIRMAIWVKIAGVYDVQSEQADLRIVIAADAEKKDTKAFNVLEEDVSEFYDSLSRRYVRKLKREETKEELKKEIKTKEDPEVSVLKAIKDIDRQMAKLEKSFLEGKMKEETYRDIKKDLEKRKARLETILDLLSV